MHRAVAARGLPALPPYDEARFLTEAALLVDWYAPNVLGTALPPVAREDYLALWPQRDVIEFPLDATLDVNGWDLGKALRLMLKGNAVVQAKDAETMLHMILDGARIASTAHNPTGLAMPAFGWKLSDDEVADLATYLRAAWGNRAGPVSSSEVKKTRERIAKSANAAAGR